MVVYSERSPGSTEIVLLYQTEKVLRPLHLESYCPADFSSNPNQTHMNQLIKVFKVT